MATLTSNRADAKVVELVISTSSAIEVHGAFIPRASRLASALEAIGKDELALDVLEAAQAVTRSLDAALNVFVPTDIADEIAAQFAATAAAMMQDEAGDGATD